MKRISEIKDLDSYYYNYMKTTDNEAKASIRKSNFFYVTYRNDKVKIMKVYEKTTCCR